MTLRKLHYQIPTALFSVNQALRVFADEPSRTVVITLARLVKRGDLVRLKRGVYRFADREVDEFVLAGWLYQPSYVSLESALNVYGILPDVPAAVTSVTTITPKQITAAGRWYRYHKINANLYYGFHYQLDERSQLYYAIAQPAKALCDFIYIRRIKKLKAERIDIKQIPKPELQQTAAIYPGWVREVVNEC